jgi:hypothetical protein
MSTIKSNEPYLEDLPEWEQRYILICREAFRLSRAGQMTHERFGQLLDEARAVCKGHYIELDSLWRLRPDDWPDPSDEDDGEP